MLLFAIVLFGGEFYTGGTDIFKAFIFFNLNQIGAVCLAVLGAHGLYTIYKET